MKRRIVLALLHDEMTRRTVLGEIQLRPDPRRQALGKLGAPGENRLRRAGDFEGRVGFAEAAVLRRVVVALGVLEDLSCVQERPEASADRVELRVVGLAPPGVSRAATISRGRARRPRPAS